MAGDEGEHRRDRAGRFDEKVSSKPQATLPSPTPGVLDEDERIAVELKFGVDEEQVIRDHAISHALAAISELGTDDIVFFGGTALSRTHLAEVRLSEDIDLIALGDRREIGDRIEDVISRRFRATLGAVVFIPRIRDTKHPDASVLQVGDTRIQIQLLSSEGYPDWPTKVSPVEAPKLVREALAQL